MSKKYQDAQMMYIESDIQKVQVKTNMYINEYGNAGAFHLAREIIQNSFDECLDDASPGNTITITYDSDMDLLTVEDNGRAFDESDYDMKVFCTTLQSGSKFFRESGAASAGEFGVGLCVTNALSDIFNMTSFREYEKTKHILEFHEGVCLKDKKMKNPSGKHGTFVQFKVSKKYMGEDAELPIEDVIKWIDSLFYLDSKRLKKKKIKCSLTVLGKNGKVLESFKFKPKPFSDLLNEILSSSKKSQMSELCAFDGSESFTEDTKKLVESTKGTSVENVKESKEIHIDVALRYCTAAVSENAEYITYCNYTNTIDNGVHLEAFDEAYCRYMQQATNASMSDAQKAKLNVKWDDVRTNLFCVLNLSTNAQVGFVGNAKNKIGNKELIPYIKKIVTEELDAFFSKHSDVLKEYCKIIKTNAKARVEAAKVKTATQTERLNTFKEHLMSNYIRCNNTGKQFKVLYLTEGNSAGSSCRNGCDPDVSAFFLLRGVPANAMKCSLTKIMENKEFRDLTTILRCGIGPKCDVSKLYFDRINIFTDADIDGYNISAGLLAFFYKFMRPVIEAGKLYKVYSPLYKLNDKDHPYAANKAELIEIYHKKIMYRYKVKNYGNDKYMTKKELKGFLMDTYDYAETLQRVANDAGYVNKYLVEIILATLVRYGGLTDKTELEDLEEKFKSQKFIMSIMNKIQKKFPEIIVDNHGVFSGIVDGKYNYIKINKRLLKKSTYLIRVYLMYGYTLSIKEKDNQPVKMSIGEFLDSAQKVLPQIVERYKGLGELNSSDLFKTTLDLNNAVSVQYTVKDVEKELKTFELTHGSSKADAEGRKRMMKMYKIRREDLDN